VILQGPPDGAVPPPRKLELPVIEPTTESAEQIAAIQREIRGLARRRDAWCRPPNNRGPKSMAWRE
jgi:hypothetical protein